MAKSFETKLPPPWLKRIWVKDELVGDRDAYPFNVPIFNEPGFELRFESPVTIIIGDNGSGKSTLLECIAGLAGFGKLGGSRDHQQFNRNAWDEADGMGLARVMGESWLPKMARGWFFRAESFFSLSHYLEQSAFDANEIGPGFLEHSHGEGFMRYFNERSAKQGLYVLDEPESALSPLRQFELMRLLIQNVAAEKAQVVIATHSPILMAFPQAKVFEIGSYGLREVDYRSTAAFRLYREFFVDPDGTIEIMTSE
jgi:predicted ATPase